MSSGFPPSQPPRHHRQRMNVCNHNDRNCTCHRQALSMTSPNTLSTFPNGMGRVLSPLPEFVVGSSRGTSHQQASHYQSMRAERPRHGDGLSAVGNTSYRGPTSPSGRSAPIPIPSPTRRQSLSAGRANAYGSLDENTSSNTYGTGAVSHSPPSLIPSASSVSTVSSSGMPATPPSPPQYSRLSSSESKETEDNFCSMEARATNVFDRGHAGRDYGHPAWVSANGRPWVEAMRPPPTPRLPTIPLPPVKHNGRR